LARLTLRLFVVLGLAAAVAPVAGEALEPKSSVVRIVNYSQRGDWYSPWDVSGVSESSGSGFIVSDGLVMTNAHVVSNSRLLLILVHNDPNPYVAEVVHIAHDTDLALIRPTEPGVLDRIPRLSFGDELDLGTTVETLGYPMGGTQVSSTRGVVSRIEEQLYLHSGKDLHLTVQTDAAINPGSSGGPVVQDGVVVGVAFQANLNLQSVGFFIPMEVIERFLRDVEDGRYDGYPELGVDSSGLENPAPRSLAGMREDETGVRIHRVYRQVSADGRLRDGDVLLSIDGRQVANDGSVADGDGRIPYGLLVDRKQIGETVSIRVLRDGARLDFEIPLSGYPAAETQGHIYDRPPRYFIYGGLVFVPLNRETLKTYGMEWQSLADEEMLHEFLVRPLAEPDLMLAERVVLLRRLKHPVNADMAWYRNQIVERVNGNPIANLEDLVDTLQNHQGKYHLIEFSNLRRIGVLDRRGAVEAHDEILERYGIEKDRNL